MSFLGLVPANEPQQAAGWTDTVIHCFQHLGDFLAEARTDLVSAGNELLVASAAILTASVLMLILALIHKRMKRENVDIVPASPLCSLETTSAEAAETPSSTEPSTKHLPLPAPGTVGFAIWDGASDRAMKRAVQLFVNKAVQESKNPIRIKWHHNTASPEVEFVIVAFQILIGQPLDTDLFRAFACSAADQFPDKKIIVMLMKAQYEELHLLDRFLIQQLQTILPEYLTLGIAYDPLTLAPIEHTAEQEPNIRLAAFISGATP